MSEAEPELLGVGKQACEENLFKSAGCVLKAMFEISDVVDLSGVSLWIGPKLFCYLEKVGTTVLYFFPHPKNLSAVISLFKAR